MNKSVAFIGLGVMGYPMAGHLANAGCKVSVYNRSQNKAARWASEYAGLTAPTPAAAASGADIVCVCVGNDDDVRAVVLGEVGALAAMKPGSILVDHTTASAELAEELAAAAAERGVGFVDAPVSGGEAGAVNGALTIMCGGEQLHFDEVVATLNHYARAVTLLGPVGSGQRCKMVNQICIAGLLQGLSEALLFAREAGLDGAKVVDVISKGAAQSWQMENRAKTMLADQYDFGFAVDWMRKDLGIVVAAAEKLGVDLQVTRLVDEFYAEVQKMGGGRWDTSSLFARMEKLNREKN